MASNDENPQIIHQDGVIHASGMVGTVAGPTSSRPSPSFRACIACRQMKMKCEGVENPPCIRCRKVGRECIPQTSTRKTARTSRAPTQNLPSSEAIKKDDNNSPEAIPRGYSSLPSTSPINDFRERHPALLHQVDSSTRESADAVGPTQNDIVTELPSIYSTPPIDAIAESNSGAASPHVMGSMSIRKRKRQSGATPDVQLLMTPAQSYRSEDGLPIDRKDMRDMINIFQQRHVPYIAVFGPEDFQDLDYIIDYEPSFAYAMCYITARYLPGGKEIREALLPEVCHIPRDVYTSKLGSRQDDLSLLKALTVLYSYADLTPPSQAARPSGKESLLYWSLKSAAEMYGFRLSLHRSIQELNIELRTNAGHIEETKSYQRFTYWLWLYNMSHYCSVVTGTPPTLRVDLSIRAVPGLLDQIGRYPRSSNLFGTVELFLIWERASTKHSPQLGEWWCLPDPTDDRADQSLTESLLNETDREIDTWYAKWWDYMNAGPRGAFLDYHGRFTRFCIASYAIKCLKITSQGLTNLQKSQIQRCVSCANHVLEFPLNLGPLQKDNLRYVDDAACIMVSFCCIFLISACQTFSSTVSNISECLDNVTDAAQLMLELSINRDHKPYLQGTFILKRVEAFRAAIETSRLHEHQGANPEEPPEAGPSPSAESSKLMSEGFDQLFQDDGLFGLEPIWDFSMLFPGSGSYDE